MARVVMSRESAWPPRRRHGAENFAAAWDMAQAFGTGQAAIAPKRKITPFEWHQQAYGGVPKVAMRRSWYGWTERKPDTSALLRRLAVLGRSLRQGPQGWTR